MYIVFDTETTGRPLKFNAPWTDTENWPRLVQLAWIEYDKDGQETFRYNKIIKPDGYVISQEAIEVHKITNEKAHEEGILMIEALNDFKAALDRNSYLIAHNIGFDLGVMGCEFHRLGMETKLAKLFPVDTMKLTTNFCKLPGYKGRYKFPSLTELHKKLFNKEFDGAHDALFDVLACARCFFELQKIGFFGFKEEVNNAEEPVDQTNVNITEEEAEKPLVHFSCHTHYSLLTGAGSVDNYLKKASKLNHPAIAVTDIGTMSGTLELWIKSKKYGIKPIMGAELFLNETIGSENEEKGGFPIKIIIKNQQGYQNLNKLLYKSHTEGFDGACSRITTQWLLESKEGLMVTCGNYQGYIANLFFIGQKEKAVQYWNRMVEAFGEDFIAEIKFNELNEQKRFNNFILKMASKTSVTVILDNDVHYVNREDAELQDVVTAIKDGRKMEQVKLMERRNLYYLSRRDYYTLNVNLNYNYPKDVLSIFMDNTLKIAERCSFEFEVGKSKYPKYEPDEDMVKWAKSTDVEVIIKKLAFAKLKQKLERKFEKGVLKKNQETINEYTNRLEYEIQVIKDKGMLDYFMVNWEILRYYRSQGYETGSARGSAAGSLLSWCLDITKIDPLQFGLYFERFLNPERNSNPDIDIDFMAGTDHVILEFLYKKYGKERVMNVGNFSKWNEKGCLKDVVRAHRGSEETGFDSDVAQVTKEMPEKFFTVDYTLAEWFENHPKRESCSPLVKRWIEDPKNAKIIEHTLALQGQVRGFGQHAAGIVITPGPSWDYIPVNIIGSNRSIVSAFQESDGGGKDLSLVGILKLDCLKLSTMNVVMDCINMIKSDGGPDLFPTIMNIDEQFSDENLYKELMLGQNHGVFQFESPGMNGILKGIKIENFNELVSANALYRPAPIQANAHNQFIKNKWNPKAFNPPSELLRPALEPTNGVIIFQEQVQFIANTVAKMNLGEGDLLRRAMEKAASLIKKINRNEELDESELNSKNYLTYQEYWGKFVQGAKNAGVSEEEIEKILSYMSDFVGYSFNKSHGVSYAFIAMQTLYLKHYYPTYFYTALLNETEGKKDQNWLTKTIAAAISKGIKVLAPSRKSKWEWAITGENEITMGLNSINNMGKVAYEELMSALKAKNKTFDTITMAAFFDLPLSKFNKTSFTVCLKAGIFDDWSSSREYLLNLHEKQKKKRKKAVSPGQFALFDLDDMEYKHKVESAVFSTTTKGQKKAEFIEVCGFDMDEIYRVSMIQSQMEVLNQKSKHPVLPITSYEHEGFYWFMLRDILYKKTKKGKDYICVVGSDGLSNVRFNLFPPMSEKVKNELQKNGVYVGRFTKKDGWLNYDTRTKIVAVMHPFENKLLV